MHGIIKCHSNSLSLQYTTAKESIFGVLTEIFTDFTMELTQAVLVVVCLVNAVSALYPVEDCPTWRDTTESREEQCIQQAACLRVGAIHMYLDQSTPFYGPDENPTENEVLGLFCRNMELFDEAVLENLLYLRELGCNDERPMLDKETQQSVMTSTSEFWNRSRSFLHSIYQVVCTRMQNEVCPNDDLMPHIKAFARCFDDSQAGSWDLFPVTSFNRRWLCEFVYGNKNCTDVHAIARPCGGTSHAETVLNMNEQFNQMREMADCEALRLH